jgi:integrase
MARTVKDTNLDSRAARSKLKPRGKPYYRTLDPGLHLGYRKLRGGAGKWVVRLYAGSQAYVVETIATADDLSDANAADVLNFAQAQTKARELRDERSRSAAGISGPYTVSNALEDYLLALEERDAAHGARLTYEAFIKEPLGHIELSALKAKKIREWHSHIAKQGPRLRTRPGEEQRYAKVGNDPDSKRRRRASANRVLTVLKSALNRAWREGHAASDTEWRRVKPFAHVGVARVRYLTVAEAKRLVNACDQDFRQLVQAALETGARHGELIRLQVADFNRDTGTVAIYTSRKNKRGRHVVLTDEGRAFFQQICAGRAGDEPMFIKADGLPWQKSQQAWRMTETVARAKIAPAIGFHGLRHTWASLAVMNGTPLLVVARNLGHSTTRMVEQHYGHLSSSYVADAIRAGAPRFGFKPDQKLAELR